jgi:cytochrome c biogenesis protein CcmG, thiol:disulfide interchange protein DsbE
MAIQPSSSRGTSRTPRRARRARMAAPLAFGISAALVLVILLRPFWDPASDEGAKGSLGRALPNLVLRDFDGGELTFGDYAGRPLVVNFWASWCPPCAAEMPDFERVHESVGERVAFLGVNMRDDRNLAEDLAESTGVTYRLAEDPQGRLFQTFETAGMPTTVFIDADGTVVDVVAGQLTEAELRERIGSEFGVRSG